MPPRYPTNKQRPGPRDRSNSRPDAGDFTGFNPDAGRTGKCPRKRRADKPELSPHIRAAGSGSDPYGFSDIGERQPDADEPDASVHPGAGNITAAKRDTDRTGRDPHQRCSDEPGYGPRA